MKITEALIAKFIRLAKGESLPASSLNGDLIEQMLSDGILVTSAKGSRKSIRAQYEQSLRDYLSTRLDIRNLETYYALLNKENASRAEQVKVTGNSKTRQQRTFCGFLVNSYDPIPAKLAGRNIEILPEDGTFVFIYDFKTFTIPDDVAVVGVENAENFKSIREQRWLFESCIHKGVKLLFASRYPQSSDLQKWLSAIPNQYIHFGDLDLAGVHIYLSEYYQYLGNRASFLIPGDYEARIAMGSRERYDDQYGKFHKMEIQDSRLMPLVTCIHKLHKGYDQEGFIMG